MRKPLGTSYLTSLRTNEAQPLSIINISESAMNLLRIEGQGKSRSDVLTRNLSACLQQSKQKIDHASILKIEQSVPAVISAQAGVP